jgi:hypothetical protein
MAIRSPRIDLHPPCISRTFNDFASPIVLADQAEPTLAASPNGAPAEDINHLPSSIFVVCTTSGTITWTDALGNSNTTAALPTGAYPLPFTMRTIESVSSFVGSITVSWHPEA